MSTSFEERLIVDSQSIGNLVHSVTDEVRQLREDSFVARILQDKDIDAIRDWEKKLADRGKQPFSLVVMGDFKRGKSMLINAILGKVTVMTNSTPETVTINRVKYGTIPQAEAVLENGMRVHLDGNELSREAIESLEKNFPSPIDHIDIFDSNELLRDICITDTPGLGDVFKRFDSKVQSYIANSDAIIYVVSALSPMSETEQMFLASVLSPLCFSRLFVVVNFADCMDSEAEIDKVSDMVLDRARAISPSSVVCPVSALNEFNRKTGRKSPNPALEEYLNAAFGRFESILQSDLLLNKDVVRAERIAILLKSMLKDIRGKITTLCSLLTEHSDKLAAEEQRCNDDLANINTRLMTAKEALNALMSTLCPIAESWMREFFERIKAELQNLKRLPAQDLQRHLQFYLLDKIREASIQCLSTHRQMVEQETRKQLALLDKDIYVAAGGQEVEVVAELADVSWTGIDTIALFINSLGLGGNPIVDILLGFLREWKVNKSSDKIIDSLMKNFPDIENACMAQLRKIYDLLAEQSLKHIEEIYTSHIHSSLDALKQAQAILHKENVKKEDVEEKLAMATRILDRADQFVEDSGFLSRIQKDKS